MKKKILILSIAILAVAAVGLGAFGIAGAAGLATRNLPALDVGGPAADAVRIFGHRGEGPLRPYIEEATADILGITVEELQTALEDGTPLTDLIAEAGLTNVEFHTALEAAWPGIVEQALADDEITEEQADTLLANGLPGGDRIWFGALKPYVLEASAEILGVSAEAFQTALDEGSVSELLETAGMSHLEFRMALDEATPGIVQQALADEAITQEQADRILEYGLPFGAGCGGGHHGRSGGPGGHSGPGGQGGPGGFEGPGDLGMFPSDNG